MAIWFRFLETDWFCRRRPALKTIPFVLATTQRGRKVIIALNPLASQEGITPGSTVADAQASIPLLQAFDTIPEQATRLLTAIGHWCYRFTPVVAVDNTDGLLMEITGCAHLWGGEAAYLAEITKRLQQLGYQAQAAIADTAGAAWAMARYGPHTIVAPGRQTAALQELPPAALRLSAPVQERLQKLGFRHIKGFINMPRAALSRRFGTELLQRLDEALGTEAEVLQPLVPPATWRERLPCLEPVCTRTGIEIAIEQLLEKLCLRLQQEGKGIRNAVLSGNRIDGQMVQISLCTLLPSVNTKHLFKLFELKIASLEPAPGIELFTLEATDVEDLNACQETMFAQTGNLADKELAELIDRISSKLPDAQIRRYLPAAHYWPEECLQVTTSLTEGPITDWPQKPRPVELLAVPEPIEVTAPIPDYPPMLFRYKGSLHTIKKADGPERIERAWWMDAGKHRDYYSVEDEQGRRYWVFRLGHYDNEQSPGWFIHGFFA